MLRCSDGVEVAASRSGRLTLAYIIVGCCVVIPGSVIVISCYLVKKVPGTAVLQFSDGVEVAASRSGTGGAIARFMHSRSRKTIKPSHPYKAGTEPIRFSPTR